MGDQVSYAAWVKKVPATITGDRLWRVEAYRLALFAADLGWYDVTRLFKDRRTIGLADQLYRALGSIGANVAEGFSRGTGRDRARFYEYALGSAREARDWYYKGRYIAGEEITEHRLELTASIIRLLLTMVPEQRSSKVKEGTIPYQAAPEFAEGREPPFDRERLEMLLQNAPT